MKPPLIVNVSDGRGDHEMGHSHLSDTRGWDWLFHGTERGDYWKAHTPRQLAEDTGGMWLHNPGGRYYRPMVLDDFSRTKRYAFKDPGNKRLQRSVDTDEFIDAARRFSADFWLGLYVGGGRFPKSYPINPSETSEQWAIRAEGELQTIIQAQPDMISFDGVTGQPVNPDSPHSVVVDGPTGGQAILIRRLQALGFEVGVEPTVHRDSGWYLKSCTAVITDNAKDGTLLKNWMALPVNPLLSPLAFGQQPVVIMRNITLDRYEESKRQGYAVLGHVGQWDLELFNRDKSVVAGESHTPPPIDWGDHTTDDQLQSL